MYETKQGMDPRTGHPELCVCEQCWCEAPTHGDIAAVWNEIRRINRRLAKLELKGYRPYTPTTKQTEQTSNRIKGTEDTA